MKSMNRCGSCPTSNTALGVLAAALAGVVASVVFHHSNLRLPNRLERSLVGLIVPPRMHGNHHSIVDEERDSNWSSGLTIWDRLHGTLKLSVPQNEITIGVPGYENELSFPDLIALPFLRPEGRRATGDERDSADPEPTNSLMGHSADRKFVANWHAADHRDLET